MDEEGGPQMRLQRLTPPLVVGCGKVISPSPFPSLKRVFVMLMSSHHSEKLFSGEQFKK